MQREVQTFGGVAWIGVRSWAPHYSGRMTTRGGKKNERKLEELAGLVRMLIGAQATKDDWIEKAFAIQESRWRSMEQQCTQIQQQVSMVKERRLRRQKDERRAQMERQRKTRQQEIEEKLIKEETARRVEEDDIEPEVLWRVEEAKRIMERQLLDELERQRQAGLTIQKAREEEEKARREELVKIHKIKSELERAAAEKLKLEQKRLEEMVQYQRELELQLMEKERKRQEAYEEFLKEKLLVDELVRKTYDED
ncbi:Arginine and glutamate-rich protein 1-A [Dissostichus eleginoides]|uniref:Arginine and glutamate-rich protein 1-A n=1 Tax=Dissostichus eleginoides TaxID=100907 RepID=A0AAD9BCE9_DISEL|nr:Arginine and glutamate-rich protein 1-A [Dissostichus eleginoides]